MEGRRKLVLAAVVSGALLALGAPAHAQVFGDRSRAVELGRDGYGRRDGDRRGDYRYRDGGRRGYGDYRYRDGHRRRDYRPYRSYAYGYAPYAYDSYPSYGYDAYAPYPRYRARRIFVAFPFPHFVIRRVPIPIPVPVPGW